MILIPALTLAAGLLAADPVAQSAAERAIPNSQAQTAALSSNIAQAVDSQYLQPLQEEDINGRLWVGRPIIGGIANPVRDRRQDGASRYGAYGEGGDTIVVSVDGLFQFQSQSLAEIRPFESVIDRTDVGNPYSNPYSNGRKAMSRRIEAARQQWLKDNNYVGGVRTFVNDATLLRPAQAQSGAALPEPRGVLELAPDSPRFKSRMRVQTEPAAPRNGPRRSAGVIKVLPLDQPKMNDAKQAADQPAPSESPRAAATEPAKTNG